MKDFREAWAGSTMDSQLAMLKNLGREGLGRLFSTDVPEDIFESILDLFVNLDGSEELAFNTLTTLTQASRFSLCLMFMEAKSKAKVRLLIETLEKKGFDSEGHLRQIYL